MNGRRLSQKDDVITGVGENRSGRQWKADLTKAPASNFLSVPKDSKSVLRGLSIGLFNFP